MPVVKNVKSKKKAVASSAKKKLTAIKDRQTRMEILQLISDQTGLKRVEVERVFDSLKSLIERHLKTRGSGEFNIPKIGVKIRRVRRRPTKERKMTSPLTGSEVVIPAKPARDDVKLIALKPLKETIEGKR